MKKKIKVLITLFILIMPIISVSMTYEININKDDQNKVIIENDRKNQLKNSNFWSVPSIYIKNDNWSALPWIQVGDGTKENPHVIENVTIEGDGYPGSQPTELIYGILIENSTDYFRIENCTVYNFMDQDGDMAAGIVLYNTSHGMFINNNFSFNSHGMLFSESDNNTISNNTLSDNLFTGLFLNDSHNNTISNNSETINNNGFYGIYLYSSHQNQILENLIGNNPTGISLIYSNFNFVKDNFLNRNTISIFELGCTGNIFINNQVIKGSGGSGGRPIDEGDDDDDDDAGDIIDPMLFIIIVSIVIVVVAAIVLMNKKKLTT